MIAAIVGLDIEEIPCMVEEQKTHRPASPRAQPARAAGVGDRSGQRDRPGHRQVLAELGADLVLVDRGPMDTLCKEIEALGQSAFGAARGT